MFGAKIKLDKDLIDRCKKYSQEAGYSSVEEFVTHVLERELRKRADSSPETDQEIRKQLQGLGYVE